MSTMTLRALPPSKPVGFGRLIVGGLGRVAGAVALLAEVFAEAQQVAADAHRRLPFVQW